MAAKFQLARASLRSTSLSLFAAAALVAADARAQATIRVNLDSAGVEAMGQSRLGAMSADGRFVAFQSDAANLLPPGVDTNGFQDVLVKDTVSGATTRVSVGPLGIQADKDCVGAAISGNGRFVVFNSDATNLTSTVDPLNVDVYVHDRQMSTTFRASVPMAVGMPNGPSTGGAVSGNGARVVFQSLATNLVMTDSNGFEDVFVRNIAMPPSTVLVSVDPMGAQANGPSRGASISADGRFVAFWSDAFNLVPSDTNGVSDIFVRDLLLNTTERVSVGTGTPGAQGNDGCQPDTAISGDGRYVVFGSLATNLVASDTNASADVFVRDRTNATTTRVSVDSSGAQANGGSTAGPITADGQFVAFSSVATNLVLADANGVEDVFVHDMLSKWTSRESVNTSGAEVNAPSSVHSVALQGWRVAFSSPATNVVLGDNNMATDVFIRDRACPPTVNYCTAGTTTNGCQALMLAIGTPDMSATSGFTLRAIYVEGAKTGLIFYGISGQAASAWGSGGSSFLCVKAPTQRTPVQNSGGNINLCDGQLEIDFLAFMAASPSALGQPMASGQLYCAQAWFRDPAAVKSTSLSDGLQWTLCP